MLRTQICGSQFVVNRTFIDVYDEDRVARRRGGRRAKSVGDVPSTHAEPMSAVQQKHCAIFDDESAEDVLPSGGRARREGRAKTNPALYTSSPPAIGGVSDERPASFEENRPMLAVEKTLTDKAKSVDDVLKAIEDAKSASEVFDLTSAICSQLSSIQAVAAVHQLAKLFEPESQPSHPPYSLSTDARYRALVKRLAATASSLDSPRLMMRVLWALGKVGAFGPDVDAVVVCIAALAPQHFKQFTPQDLSNTLWGLARLASTPEGLEPSGGDHRLAGKARRDALQFACLLVSESNRRVESLSDQCLSNNLWAIAKLDLRGSAASFARACVAQLRSRPPSAICPQALANSLWAVARLQLDSAVAMPFCTDVARRALDSPGALGAFLSHELSMALWAIARIARAPPPRGVQRGGGNSRRGPAPEILAFADGISVQACARIRDFSPQSLSNIAWALASMNLTQREPARKFLLLAAEVSGPELRSHPPQAIANLCWAFSKLGGGEASVASFGIRAAQEARAPERARDFTWQDQASVASALARLGLSNLPEVHAFSCWLVRETSGRCNEIGTQSLLNIATSSVRLGVGSDEMRPFAWEIAEVFTGRTAHLNDIDMRQWLQVQRHCGLPGVRGKSSAPAR